MLILHTEKNEGYSPEPEASVMALSLNRLNVMFNTWQRPASVTHMMQGYSGEISAQTPSEHPLDLLSVKSWQQVLSRNSISGYKIKCMCPTPQRASCVTKAGGEKKC